MRMTTIVVEEDGKKKYKRVPLEQTPEEAAADEAAIAFLDELRSCAGEEYPKGLPLACIVKVVDYQDIPKAKEAYALVRVEGFDKRTWRMCVNRKSVRVGKNALFVSERAALPVDDRFRNLAVCKVKEKKYKFGFGVTIPQQPGRPLPDGRFPRAEGEAVGDDRGRPPADRRPGRAAHAPPAAALPGRVPARRGQGQAAASAPLNADCRDFVLGVSPKFAIIDKILTRKRSCR